MCTIKDELNINGGTHVLAVFKLRIIFEWIVKQLLDLAFASYEELWRSRGELSALADNTLLDLHDSS